MSWSLLGVTRAVSPPKLVLVNTWPQSRHRGEDTVTRPRLTACVTLSHYITRHRDAAIVTSAHDVGRVPPTGHHSSWHMMTSSEADIRSRNHGPVSWARPGHQSHRQEPGQLCAACLRPRQWPGHPPHLSWGDQTQTQTVENVRLAPSLVSPRLLFVASWQSGHFVTKLGPVRNWIITSSSSRICRDLRILLTLIPGNSSQLAKMLCIRELSLGGKHAAREISSYLDLCYWLKWSRNHALTLLHRTIDDRHLYLSPANTQFRRLQKY